jgi:exodeoxyribonuclease-3
MGFKRFDNEGRFLELKFANFTLINIYLPHGGRDKSKLAYKLECYRRLFRYLKKIRYLKIILIGDFNIAHQEIDLERHKHNNDNIMFTPKEREQISKIISLSFIDSFRKFNEKNGNYTWWPYAFNARARNVGWRIDYAFISKKLYHKLKKAKIYKDVFGSDHCPIGVELK